jgi:regulator of extracellular matrix RemA (YlzA/DUF370 family)
LLAESPVKNPGLTDVVDSGNVTTEDRVAQLLSVVSYPLRDPLAEVDDKYSEIFDVVLGRGRTEVRVVITVEKIVVSVP